MHEAQTIDLHEILANFSERVPGVRSMRLFGSRRYKTGSLRSDIDLLVEFDGSRPTDRQLAEAVRRVSVYIDPFVVSGNSARSAINGSTISASPGKTVAETLDAVEIWTKATGIADQTYRHQVILSDWVPVYTVAAHHGDRTAARQPSTISS
jgi:predicted nucleotidyltransferase